MAKLEKARKEFHAFETIDLPAFGQWMSGKFGALQSESREYARQISEKRWLVEEVEMEIRWSGMSPRKAYAEVIRRRENPEPEDDPFSEPPPWEGEEFGAGPEEDWDDDFTEGEGVADFECRRELFEEFLFRVGIVPEGLTKREYASMFAEFQQEAFGDVFTESPREENGAQAGSSPSHAIERRIKEIYRALVRRLHPDLKADQDRAVSALWHEVQEAYEQRNLERLETLLAVTEMENGGDGAGSSLSQMRAAGAELRRSLSALQRSLSRARKEPAWRFDPGLDHSRLEARFAMEIQSVLAEQRSLLAYLNRLIESWSRPDNKPVRNRQQKKKPSKSKDQPGNRKRASETPLTQMEFF
jgi:hypothetical protein